MLDRVGPQFALEAVEYTSSTDAAAGFTTRRGGYPGTIIATTDDNWAHAARLYIRGALADLVYYSPLGDGAVAIKAQPQTPGMNYPGFVLYPNGKTKPLRVLGPKARGRGDVLLDLDRWGSILYGLDRPDTRRLWAADVDAAEVYPVEGTRFGDVWQRVQGRKGAILSVQGFKRRDQQWQLRVQHRPRPDLDRHRRRPASREVSRRPRLRRRISGTAVGPGHLQATVSTTFVAGRAAVRERALADRRREAVPPGPAAVVPTVLRRRRVRRGRRTAVRPITGPDTYCGTSPCTRPGTIWRFPRGAPCPSPWLVPRPCSAPIRSVGISTSGGVIVARTGMRTISISYDGYRWTPVTPG